MNNDHTVILVHGAWHGSWCWDLFQPELRQRGIEPIAVDLTSHGGDASKVGDLHSDTELVRSVARGVDGPVVLLGHSYGGIVITEAAEALDNVSQLVYLAAFVADVGGSVKTLTGGGNAPFISASADGLLSIVEGWGQRLFYTGCDPDVAAHAESQLQPQSAASFGQPASATSYRAIPSSYLLSRDDHAIPPTLQRQMADLVGGSVVELSSGHSPFLSQPGRLAELLRHQLDRRLSVARETRPVG